MAITVSGNIKTFLRILIITVIALPAMAVLISIFYSKEIKKIILDEINKNVTTEIAVKDFDFSLIHHFPYASFELNNVIVKDAFPQAKQKDTLLQAEKVAMLFNVMQIFNKNISVKRIIVSKGKVTVRVNEKGEVNYKIWKTDSVKTGGESSVIDLSRIDLSDVAVNYIDKQADQQYNLHAKSARLAATFSEHGFSLNAKGNLFVQDFFVHKQNYVHQHTVDLDASLSVDNRTGVYLIKPSVISIDGVKNIVEGMLTDYQKKWSIDLAVRNDENELNSFINILPVDYRNYFNDFKVKGSFKLNGKIKGNISSTESPDVAFDFNLNSGKLSKSGTTVDGIALNGIYRFSKTGKNHQLKIDNIKANFEGYPFSASLDFTELPDAFLKAKIQSKLDLSKLLPLFKTDTVSSLSGLAVLNINYAGRVREITRHSDDLLKVNANGNISLQNVAFSLKNNPLQYKNMNGNFTLANNDIHVESFTGNISGTDFRIKGDFRNFINFLLIPGQPGDFYAEIKSKNVTLDELLTNKSSALAGDTSYIMKFNPRLICHLNVSVDKLQFRRIVTNDLRGDITLNHQVISGNNLQFKAMNGFVSMDAMINASRRDSVLMSCDATVRGIEVKRLFYEFENFDQSTLTDQNLNGKVSADIQFTSAWSVDLTLNSKSFRSTAAISIENGELKNFKPILALSKYIKVADLNDIHFANLKNTISISDRKIFIPSMEIKSSAIDISGNGVHDFDNNIDYHISLLLSDVLGKKVKLQDEFGEIEDDGLGRTKLFLAMKGSVDNPKFAYDRKGAAQKVKTDIKEEKQTLKAMLKEEFGLFKKDTTVVRKKQTKKEELEIDWSNSGD